MTIETLAKLHEGHVKWDIPLLQKLCVATDKDTISMRETIRTFAKQIGYELPKWKGGEK